MAKEPGEAAIEFLVKIKEGKLDLKSDTDTALSPHITDRKLKIIEQSIQNLSSQIGPGKFTLGKMRQDGDFAAVMVRQGEEHDQINVQVYPVALVNGDKGWRAAPILASYENAVVAYTVSLRERLSGLESWMMQQRVLETEGLKLDVAEKLKQRIKTEFQDKNLSTANPVGILNRFQQAYSEGRQIELLGYLGGCSDPWPSDWNTIMNVMREALTPKVREQYPWRLLASSDVVRVTVGSSIEDKEAMVSMACLDPLWADENDGADDIHVIHFSFKKDDQGNWRMELPNAFLQNDKQAFLDGQGMDGDLLEDFTERLRSNSPAQYAKTFEEAEQKVISLLEHGSMGELLRWVEFEGSAEASKKACVTAAKDWWSVHAPGNFRAPVKMDSRVEGDWAVSVYHWFSLTQGARVELKPLYFHKTSKGWAWFPGDALKIKSKVSEVLSAWSEQQSEDWRESATKKLLAMVLPLEKLSLETPVQDAQVKELVQKWRTALEEKRIRELFAMSARLGEADTTAQKSFRNLAYELSLAQRSKAEFKGIYRSGKWTAAGFAHGDKDNKVYSLMLIVPTPDGLRVLSEIDLVSEDTRTRKYLNQVSFDRLKTFVSESELLEIKALFEQFEKAVR